MADYKKNVAIKVNYIALNKTTGLTDLVMHVYDEAGVYFTTVAMTEYVDGSGFTASGLYYGSFTPDAKGQWRIRIQSASNLDDMQRIFEIGDYDVDEVKSQLDTVEGKVDTIDGVVDTIDGKVDTLTSDVADLQSDVTTIDGNVDSIKTTVESTATDVGLIKAKTDNLPSDTASELTYIKNKIDSIDTQINPGGYILR